MFRRMGQAGVGSPCSVQVSDGLFVWASSGALVFLTPTAPKVGSWGVWKMKLATVL